MKTRSILMAGWIAVVLATTTRAQFVPGHVFAAQSAGKLCKMDATYGSDRIWEINPDTGEATLFAELPVEMCGFLTGLAFTPDGTRLRAASLLRSWILEFDSEGNVSIVLDSSDGIACPWGFNNLAYDAEGNFYVGNCTRDILRFPADGGPATVFADAADGVAGDGAGGAIAFAADGDLYFTNTFVDGIGVVRRITPDGNAFPFDEYTGLDRPKAILGDRSGHIYVGLGNGEIFRYRAGDPASKELFAVFAGGRHSMAMPLDQREIYVNAFSDSDAIFGRVLRIDVVDGAVTTVSEFTDGFITPPAGIAVVPLPPPPIPTVSGWSVIAMTLLVLTAGTAVLIRCRRAQP